MERILITGATGNFGGAAIAHLLKQGFPAANISALARNEEKAQDLKKKGVDIRLGNYDDYGSLVSAFEGVDKLLLVSGTDLEKRLVQHKNAVNAAKEAGVNHFFYTSFERKNESEDSPIAKVARAHIETEKQMKDSGMSYTIFRNNIYMDMIPVFAGENVTETGLYFPAGDTGVAFALRKEMAEAAANVLTGKGHENKEYHFSNTENITFSEIGDIISEATGKAIPYTDPGNKEYLDTLLDNGVPKEMAEMSASFAEGMKQGEFKADHTDLDKLLGRKPTTAQEFLKQVYS